MFWTANFVGPNELNVNSLLKEENLSLTQLLDADDILQECRTDNKALIEYLTKPEILTELVTLITEEPPKDVELTLQYRHANMACEVLTCQMSALSVRLLADSALMNRLCDFVNKEPPLNPLLASYFSKTIEVLLDKSPQQDWCLHRIVCLQVVEVFRARQDFLPNLLRHVATSSIADVFRVFIRLKENVVVEWLKEHRFLESLIQIICGTYVPEEIFPPSPPISPPSPPSPSPASPATPAAPETVTSQSPENDTEGGEREAAEGQVEVTPVKEFKEKENEEKGMAGAARRLRGVEAANASALLCDVIRTGCVKDVSDYFRSGTAGWLRGRLAGAADEILRCVFSSPRERRAQALLGAGDLLLELLMAQGELEAVRGGVELAAAPHLPLLHHELLVQPSGGAGGVGAARLQVAALLAQLAASAVHEVPATMLTLGTPGVLVDMFFSYSENNFLHERLHALLHNALGNAPYKERFARHFVEECDLLNRLMDAFEDIEKLKGTGKPRPGNSGHVTRILALLATQLGAADWLPAELAARWASFTQLQLAPRLTILDTPLVGYYPSESEYEAEAELGAGHYDLEEPAEPCAEMDFDVVAMTQFLSGAYYLEDGSCEDRNADLDEMFAPPAAASDPAPAAPAAPAAPDPPPPGAAPAALQEEDDDSKDPWESLSEPAPVSEEGWAQFDEAFGDPFANVNEQTRTEEGKNGGSGGNGGAKDLQDEFSPFWSYKGCEGGEGGGDANASDLQEAMEGLRLPPLPALPPLPPLPPTANLHEASTAELTNNLLTAMSSMAPELVANIVNANQPPPEPAAHLAAGERAAQALAAETHPLDNERHEVTLTDQSNDLSGGITTTLSKETDSLNKNNIIIESKAPRDHIESESPPSDADAVTTHQNEAREAGER